MRRTRLVAAGALLAALLAGCGGGKPAPPPIVAAGGTIRIEGQPLKKARVVFAPTTDYGPQYAAFGETDDAGRYTLTCNGQPGAPACECKVLVQETEPPKELQGTSTRARQGLIEYLDKLGGRPIPPRYGNEVNTPLTTTVTADKPAYDFDLSR